MADCEFAWTSFDCNEKIYRHVRNTSESRIHPTQKPIALYRWILANYAKPGDKMLDTHVGSASSLIACHQMGFNYVGFEIDADYYNAAMKRLNDAKAQTTLFDEPVQNARQETIFGNEVTRIERSVT
jgi:site-specific DNA-methyltransferase (adenine-specific)